MDVLLLSPWFLLLLVAVPLIWLWPRPARDRAHAGWRSLLLASLVFGLARPALWTEEPNPTQVFVLDCTRSAAAESVQLAEREAARLLQALPESTRKQLVILGTGGLEGSPLPIGLAAAAVRLEGGSLSDSLAAAGRCIPRGARGAITLVSDGLGTDRAWGPVLQALSERGIPLHVVRLEPSAGDVRPVGLEPEGELRVGQVARLHVRLQGEAAALDLRLLGPDGELVAERGLSSSGRLETVLEFEPREPGFLPLRLVVDVLEGGDSDETNNRLETTVAVQEPLRVLYLGDRAVAGAGSLGELVGPGFTFVDTPGAGRDLRGELALADVAFVDDRPAELLPAELQAELSTAVSRDGLGLFAAGGKAAFGPGGYHEGPLSGILPVEAVQKEEKRDPSTALVVIIDTSGSMSGNRVQLAKEVSRLAIRRLLPHDKVGIVEFYGAKRWAAPIQPASNRIELQRALNRLDAGGGTVILPAIEEAFYGLQNVQTRYKHVLVLTDGGVERGAFEPLLRKMASKGINISTVLIGGGVHSEFLVNLANWGKGRFYSVPNRFNLPEVILKQPTSSKLPAYRPGTHAVVARGGAGWWGEVDPATAPALEGYVETRARVGAEVLLETEKGAHPVLASWRYGLGRVTAMTTEPTGAGTEGWSEWAGYGSALARLLSRTASDSTRAYEYSLRRSGARLFLTASRRQRAAAAPSARLLADDGETSFDFRVRADGVYTAELVCDPAREARVLAGEPKRELRLVCSAYSDRSPELQVDPRRALDLDRAAQATGGHTVAASELGAFLPPVGGGGRPPALVALWPACYGLALLLYLVDLFHRRRSRRTAEVRP